MASRSLSGDQRGFTIIEVLVAATLLVIGVLGTMAMVDSSNAETRLSGGRDGATNLAREVVEGARSIGYDELQPASVNARLQTLPGLATTTPGSWTINRRGIVYTVTTSLCSVDDPKDGYGSHAGATYCADSSSTGTSDAQAEDFKRLTVKASWTRNSGTREVTQVALIASPGAKGPPVTSLVSTAPVVADPAAPKITSAAVTSVAFKATAPAGVSSVVYSLDGVDKGNATIAANGTDWTFDIGLAGLSDGGYDISVRAVDNRGKAGPTFTIPMTLIRGTPAAPAGLVGGPNEVYVGGTLTEVIELEWNANAERNVIGYRVYDKNGVLRCPATLATLDLKLSCIDLTATAGTYGVAALYRDAAGAVQEGPRATFTTDAFQRTFYFKQTTAFTGSGSTCLTDLSGRKRDMAEGYTGLDPEESYSRGSNTDHSLNFCAAASSTAETLKAGTTTANGYVSNSSGSSCVITATLYQNGTTALGSATITVAKGTGNQLRTWTISNPAATFAAGDQINLQFSWQQVKACDSTLLRYDGTTNRSSVTVPTRPAPPNPPTGLSATTLADGTTQLSWTAPASGNAASFYRIYRDGINQTDRLDTTGSAAETTYVDDPGGATHTYYVTAVSDKLAESAMAGPVTK